jgi:hypothetical protein
VNGVAWSLCALPNRGLGGSASTMWSVRISTYHRRSGLAAFRELKSWSKSKLLRPINYVAHGNQSNHNHRNELRGDAWT